MCDTVVALANATSQGCVIFGKNSDREPNEAQVVEYHPRLRRGGRVKCTYITIPDVDETRSVLISRPYWMWGAEMGVNENGVAIGNEAVFTNVAHERDGLIGMDLLRLGLERSRDADEGLRVITNLLEEYGQGGNCSNTQDFRYDNSFIIADPEKAWVLESAGRSWVAEKVEDIRTISNALSIHNDWDVSSKDMSRLGPRAGFDFARRYTSGLYTSFTKGKERQRFTQDTLEERRGKVDLALVKRVLRSHSHEAYSPSGGSTSDICMHAGGLLRPSQSVSSYVGVLHKDLPVHWFTCSSAPCLSLYKPFFIVEGLEKLNTSAGSRFDEASFWWSRERFHRRMLSNYDAQITTEITRIERDMEPEVDSVRDTVVRGRESHDKLLSLTAGSFGLDLEFVSKTGYASTRPLPMLYRRYWRRQNALAGIRLE